MSFNEKGNTESVEALMNTLNMDNSGLQEANLSTLSSSDLEQFAELSQTLNMSSDIENQELMASEEEISSIHIEEAEEEELVQTELGAQEIEIETEHIEEILPEAKPKSVPPLRPLTIAPKPTKVPIAITGQQLLLVQGSGQQIKLLSPQSINLSNLQLGKPLTIKPTVKTITTQGGTAQPKQVIMKKVIQPVGKSLKSFDSKQVVLVKSEQPAKIVSTATAGTSTKTITIAQAQQMGLLAGAKIVPQGNVKNQTILLSKTQQRGIKLVRSPTKILPAPQSSTPVKQPQKILLKSSSGSIITPSHQLIQVSGNESGIGQIHQINIPGKGVQYIKFVTQIDTSTTNTTTTSAPAVITPAKTAQTVSVGGKIVTIGNSIVTESRNVLLSEVKGVTKANTIAPKPVKPLGTLQTQTILTSSSTGQLLMLPASYIQRTSSTAPTVTTAAAATPKVPIPLRTTPLKQQPPSADAVVPVSEVNLETNGMRPRKPCNCAKSQCLKLYCDCFANGEFCYMCNCTNCYNNLDNEENRQRAIKNCLDRNPNAFRPKIGKSKDVGADAPVRKHTKGCNCKRSGCLKNYCECYEAKIACSSNCKCVGCRNIEDTMEKKSVRPQNVEVVFGRSPTHAGKNPLQNENSIQIRPKRPTTHKQVLNSMDVIEATTQCLLAVASHSEDNGEPEEVTKGRVIEEFGKCLVEIINSSKNKHLNVV